MKKRDLRAEQVTELLLAVSGGRREAWDDLLPAIEEELQKIALSKLRRERKNHTLAPQDLIQEVYLRFAGQRKVPWKNRKQFFGAAAKVMRWVLLNHAESRRRRPGRLPTSISIPDARGERNVLVDDLNDALSALAEIDERMCEVVVLRYFGGLTIKEAADELEVAEVTVERDWDFAKAWLYKRLS